MPEYRAYITGVLKKQYRNHPRNYLKQEFFVDGRWYSRILEGLNAGLTPDPNMYHGYSTKAKAAQELKKLKSYHRKVNPKYKLRFGVVEDGKYKRGNPLNYKWV